MPERPGKAVEMTARGSHGKPQDGFRPLPPPLEIAARFPHSHRLDDGLHIVLKTNGKEPRQSISLIRSFRLIFGLENAGVPPAPHPVNRPQHPSLCQPQI